MQFNITDNKLIKFIQSDNYNLIFFKNTGKMVRWGKIPEDDPLYAPMPEILDLEISSGKCIGCSFCYKANSPNKEIINMSFDNFKNIFDKITKHKFLQQIAFGITSIDTNPDFFRMMEYAKKNGVIPNYTCHGQDVTIEIAKRTAKLCGAVAVSITDRDKSYNAIQMFTDAGMNQINIHFMLSDKTLDRAYHLIHDITSDIRLQKLNAIVFLGYKDKNKKGGQFPVSPEEYKKLIMYCDSKNIQYGFDSCSAKTYLLAIKDDINFDKKNTFVESCESGLFSSYINVKGEFFACSFSENIGMWKEGLNVLECEDFEKDIWNNPKTIKWRNLLLSSVTDINKAQCRVCPIYNI